MTKQLVNGDDAGWPVPRATTPGRRRRRRRQRRRLATVERGVRRCHVDSGPPLALPSRTDKRVVDCESRASSLCRKHVTASGHAVCSRLVAARKMYRKSSDYTNSDRFWRQSHIYWDGSIHLHTARRSADSHMPQSLRRTRAVNHNTTVCRVTFRRTRAGTPSAVCSNPGHASSNRSIAVSNWNNSKVIWQGLDWAYNTTYMY